MNSAIILVLLSLLTAFVNNVAASCKEMANDDVLEYACEGGHSADLNSLPVNTEKLRITRMPLRRITADTFSRFNRNLLVLSCLHCEITDIDADAFRSLINLQQLNLESNYLTTVKAAWFKDLNYLTYLDLGYNHIRDIEDDVYENLPSLVDFRISGNRLRCLNLDEMSRLNELKRIFLSENSEFACPHAVSKFLENRGVVFEQDPEWRKLASDTIHVNVPPEEDYKTTPAYRERLRPDTRPPSEQTRAHDTNPVYVPPEEDYKTTPAYRERPQSNKRPPSEETRAHEVPLTRNGMLYPDYRTEYRTRNRRPTTTTPRPTTLRYAQDKMPLPRVEQISPSPTDPRTSTNSVPTELSPHQVTHYPYSTLETPRVPPVNMESSLEDIRMAETDKSSEMKRTTLPPYFLMHQTTRPYPTYPTYSTTEANVPPEESQIIDSEQYTENEMVAGSDRSLEMEKTTAYPQHNVRVTMSYDQKRVPYESSEIIYPSFTNDFDMDTSRSPLSVDRSTNVPSEHLDNPSWTQDNKHYEQSLRLTTDSDNGLFYPSTPNTADHQATAYHAMHEHRKMLDKQSKIDEPFIPTEQAKAAPLQTTISNDVYVRPSPPSHSEIMYSPSGTDQFYQAYHEGKATLHPPLQNHQERNATILYVLPLATTDKPFPDPKGNSTGNPKGNSALRIQPDAILVMFIIVTIFGHVIVEG